MKRWIRPIVRHGLEAAAILFIVLLLPVRLVRLLFRRRRRSLWAGAPIINMAFNARAERLLGVNARSLVYGTYYITSEFDYNLSRWAAKPFIGRLVPYAMFVWACIWTDRLHFYCDSGLLPSPRRFMFNMLELRLYRLLRIPVFLWTYGGDVRSQTATRALGEPNCCTECEQVGMACICDEGLRQAKMQSLSRLTTATFAMGDMIEYTPGSMNDLFFWPVELSREDRYRPAVPQNADRPLRVVHAPNHRMFKGTHFLVEAIQSLAEEGVTIDLVIVEKKSNAEALELYRGADVIFDQCLVGFHGFFAIEAMAMGKPVMCFIRKEEYLLHPDQCPIVRTHVSTLKDDLRRLHEQRSMLTELGQRGRDYIEQHFTLDAFAGRLSTAYGRLGVTL
mgnify:CR=1 FL=1